MADSVLLFVCPGILMLLDQAVDVIIRGGTGHKPRLGPALHGLFIEVQAGFLLPHELSSLHHVPQKVMGSHIDTGIIKGNALIQSCLRPVNGKEAQRFPGYLLLCLLPAVNIVRKGRDPRLQPLFRANPEKCFNLCHISSPNLRYSFLCFFTDFIIFLMPPSLRPSLLIFFIFFCGSPFYRQST